MVINIAVTQLIIRGVISWGQFLVTLGVVLVVGLVLGQVYVLPRLARRTSKHPRITSTEDWESPLAPVQALARIQEELADLEPTVTPKSSALEVAVGSDVTFRRRGAGSEVGWRALPLLVTFRAAPSGTGSRITADARDNLGWYPAPPATFVEDEILKRATALIQRAMHATDR
ncbi:hypothetical protein [Kocuria rosea]|uniref:Uncharacterized protein n=1 Tax=Kocuria rosea TaxID=1275 RepID=A0A4V3B323_KOCRO|nr:hypothetical protein [Kocuria rosea]TDL43039.1 hypothetical protein E2R59_09465 [Kocuria rosea]